MNRLSHHTATSAWITIYADADVDADDIVVAANDGMPNDGTPNNVSSLRPPSEGRRMQRCCCCCFDCSDSELLADAVVVVVIALLLPVVILVGSYNRCCGCQFVVDNDCWAEREKDTLMVSLHNVSSRS